MIENIVWLGHGGFKILGSPIIYINPWRVVRSSLYPDLILVTHEHYDHCSVADINKLRGPNTQIIGNAAVAGQIPDTMVLRPWQTYSFERTGIKAVPAYSPDDFRHPRSSGGLGFVISANFFDIYYAGDTKIIPEMDKIHPDIALLPIDNDGTMTPEEAAEVVERLRPRWVIPYNWGATGEGVSELEARRFKQLVGGRAEVIIPEVNQTIDSNRDWWL